MAATTGSAQAPIGAFEASNAHVNAALTAALQQLDQRIRESHGTSLSRPSRADGGSTTEEIPAAVQRLDQAKTAGPVPYPPLGMDASGTEEILRQDESDWRPMSRHYPEGTVHGARAPRRHVFGSTFSVDEPHTDTVVCGFNLLDFGNSLPNVLEWFAPVLGEYKIEDMCSTTRQPGSRVGSGVWHDGAALNVSEDTLDLVQQLNGHNADKVEGVAFQPRQPWVAEQYPMPFTPSAGSVDAILHEQSSRRDSYAQDIAWQQPSGEQAPSPLSPPNSGAQPLHPEPSVATHVGLLGVPVQTKARQGSLEAIRELPHHLNSATYDSMLEGLQSQVRASVVAAAQGSALPDPLAAGLHVHDDVVASCWGYGRLARGQVGDRSGDSSPISCLVTEVRVAKALDTSQLKRLNSTLRSAMPPETHRDDLSRAYGAVPAQLAHENAGVWVAWSDPLGATIAGGETKPLREALLVDPPRGFRWRLTVARQICTAMAALHSAGKNHGSFGPRSVMVGAAGDVSIVEIGLVDALLEVGVLREYDLLQYLGLEFARYLAPEGWHVPRQASPAADIWALGLILLEILCGIDPPNVECTNMQQLSAKMLPKRGKHNPLSGIRDGPFAKLPPMCRRTIEACFSAAPSARPDALRVLFSLSAVDEAPPCSSISSTTEAIETCATDAHPAAGTALDRHSHEPSAKGSSDSVLHLLVDVPSRQQGGEGRGHQLPPRDDSRTFIEATPRQLPPPRADSCPTAETPRETDASEEQGGVTGTFVPAPREKSWPPMHEARCRGDRVVPASIKRAARGVPPPPPPAPPAFGKPTRHCSTSDGSHDATSEEQLAEMSVAASLNAGLPNDASAAGPPRHQQQTAVPATDAQPSISSELGDSVAGRGSKSTGRNLSSNFVGSMRRSFGRITG